MSLVIPVSLPGLMPAAPSLKRHATGRHRRRRGRAVPAQNREHFRRTMRGVRSYRPSLLVVNRVAPSAAGALTDDLDGLGRFGGFRKLRKALPRPKSVLTMAALGPAALLHKGTRKEVSRFTKSGPGSIALAAMSPIGAPALLMSKRGRRQLPGLNKFTKSRAGALALGVATPFGAPAMLLSKQGRRMVGINRLSSPFGKRGGGDDENDEPMPEPVVDPSGSTYPTSEYTEYSNVPSGDAPVALQYDSDPIDAAPAAWQGPQFVAEPTMSANPMQEQVQPYETENLPDESAPPAFDDRSDSAAMSAESGPLIYDPTVGLYQPESSPETPTDE